MDPIVNDLLNALIVGLVPVVIGALGYLANEVIKLLQANVSREQYAMLEKIAAATVASINQTLASKAGEEKKAAALSLVRSECAKRGIKLDEEAIGNAVEAAVYRAKLGA
jgi:LL-H family phage holin